MIIIKDVKSPFLTLFEAKIINCCILSSVSVNKRSFYQELRIEQEGEEGEEEQEFSWFGAVSVN